MTEEIETRRRRSQKSLSVGKFFPLYEKDKVSYQLTFPEDGKREGALVLMVGAEKDASTDTITQRTMPLSPLNRFRMRMYPASRSSRVPTWSR